MSCLYPSLFFAFLTTAGFNLILHTKLLKLLWQTFHFNSITNDSLDNVKRVSQTEKLPSASWSFSACCSLLCVSFPVLLQMFFRENKFKVHWTFAAQHQKVDDYQSFRTCQTCEQLKGQRESLFGYCQIWQMGIKTLACFYILFLWLMVKGEYAFSGSPKLKKQLAPPPGNSQKNSLLFFCSFIQLYFTILCHLLCSLL